MYQHQGAGAQVAPAMAPACVVALSTHRLALEHGVVPTVRAAGCIDIAARRRDPPAAVHAEKMLAEKMPALAGCRYMPVQRLQPTSKDGGRDARRTKPAAPDADPDRILYFATAP